MSMAPARSRPYSRAADLRADLAGRVVDDQRWRRRACGPKRCDALARQRSRLACRRRVDGQTMSVPLGLSANAASRRMRGEHRERPALGRDRLGLRGLAPRQR